MRKLAPLALSAIALLALAGCAGGGSNAGGGDSNQSVADACAIAEDKLTAAQSELNESMSAATSGDYSAASDVISSFSASFDEALDEISNPEVEAALSGVAADYEKIGAALEQLSDIGTDPEKVDEMTALSNEMTEVSSSLQTSATELAELCS
ncbi:hypothetical protein AB0N73_06625 [Microbacterium sp. NPDC089189]|uniref:hypothetical protein n=1 Tax=Microbacterium sp. NPDC089189 TaxID=3154972 RepID=UPI0034441575